MSKGLKKNRIFSVVKAVFLFLFVEMVGVFGAEQEYTVKFSDMQGVDGWYFCEFGMNDINLLEYDEASEFWKGSASGHPTMGSASMTPANTKNVGYCFLAPENGVVRISGTVELPWEGSSGGDGIIATIYKENEKIWEETVVYGAPATHDIKVSIRKGERLYFKIACGKNYNFDWTRWTPSVCYVSEAYVPADYGYTYLEKYSSENTLPYFENVDGYISSDKTGFINSQYFSLGDGYSLIQRKMITEEGRYRVYGSFREGVKSDYIIRVWHNDKVIWTQLCPQNEMSKLDVRVFCYTGDKIDVEIENMLPENKAFSAWNCNITKYIGTMFVDMSTSEGYSYNVIKEFSLSELVEKNIGLNFYSIKNHKEYPMIYNEINGRYESTAPSDTAYVSSSYAYPGNHSTSAIEWTVDESGLIAIDGKFMVDDYGDGVISKIFLNDKLIWSSRVGGERAVRWDEPYDISYFLNDVYVVADIKQGDCLKFTFDQWRKTSYDHVKLGNVKIKYVRGDVLSKTTSRKVNGSISIDTKTKTLHKDGKRKNVGTEIIDEQPCILISDADFVVEGVCVDLEEFIFEKDGKEYVKMEDLASASKMNYKYLADRYAVFYNEIETMFGYAEESELALTSPYNVTEYIDEFENYTLIDRYGKMDLPFIAVEGEFQNSLTPQNGTAVHNKETETAQIFFGKIPEGALRTLRFDSADAGGRWPKADTWSENYPEVISFDINIPQASDFAIVLKNSNWNAVFDALISDKGYITMSYGINNISSSDYALLKVKTDMEIEDAINSNGGAKPFEFGEWHRVKIIFTAGWYCGKTDNDIANRTCYLYLDDMLVGETVIGAWTNIDKIDITCFSGNTNNEIMLEIDNLKMGRIENQQISKFETIEFCVKDLSGNIVEEFNDGEEYFLELEILNSSDYLDVGLIIAEYEDEKLNKVYLQTDIVPFGENKSILRVRVTPQPNTDGIKIYLWNNMSPLIDKIDINKKK